MGKERELRLIHAFVTLLPDHQQDFSGYVRDIENVRYCSSPLDQQQLGRCEYALRNMEMLLLAMHDALHSGVYEGDSREELINTKNKWLGDMARAQSFMNEIHDVIAKVDSSLGTLREAMEQSVHSYGQR